MFKLVTYGLLALNIVVTAYALYLLGVEIGSSWWSAGPFYFVWCLIPNVLIHFGISRFGTTDRSLVWLMIAALGIFLISAWVAWHFVIRGPIGPLSMLIFMPLPLTQLLLAVPFLWLTSRSRKPESGAIRA